MGKKKFGHIEVPLQRVHLELTNICQFDCVFCPKAAMTRPPGHMDTALAKRLITEIGQNNVAEKITFHVMGEPTLHREFFDILSHAASEGVKVGLTTNGAGLGGKVGERLLEHGLHQVDVSLQTPDAGSYGLRKAGALTFDEYLEGIMQFFGKYNARYPKSIFKFRFLNTRIPQKDIEKKVGPVRVISSSRELRDTFKFWAGRIYDMLGVDAGTRERALSELGRLSALKWNVVEVYENVFLETYLLDDWGNAFGEGRVLDAWAGYCYGMRDHFSVLYNGDVALCCQDYDGKTAIGNVTESTLLEVLSSDEVGAIVDGFRHMKLVHPYCKQCLGSRSRAAWLVKPVASVLALKTLKPLFYKRTKVVG